VWMDGCNRYGTYALFGLRATTDMGHVLCVDGWMPRYGTYALFGLRATTDMGHVPCVDGWMPSIWDICSVWIDGFHRYMYFHTKDTEDSGSLNEISLCLERKDTSVIYF
jgi:hypothetical protein